MWIFSTYFDVFSLSFPCKVSSIAFPLRWCFLLLSVKWKPIMLIFHCPWYHSSALYILLVTNFSKKKSRKLCKKCLMLIRPPRVLNNVGIKHQFMNIRPNESKFMCGSVRRIFLGSTKISWKIFLSPAVKVFLTDNFIWATVNPLV